MNRLGEKIAGLIRAAGPISVADYMAICLFDADHGYYTTREPFGARGDFVTAPEVSQMFGELVAVWLAEAWQASREPMPVTIA
jgi:SAM-dependent MidA family methyltransferase